MKKVLLTCLIISCALTGYTQTSPTLLWDEANKAYEAKNYDLAESNYQQLLKTDSTNAEIYYNLGNTFFRKNDIANAVLNYERALFLKPDMQAAEYNKKIAQARIDKPTLQREKIFFVRWWQKLSRSNTSNGWSVIALMSIISFTGLFILQKTNKKKIYPQLLIALPVISLLGIYMAWKSSQNGLYSNKGVVMNHNAIFKARIEDPKETFIPEATVVTIYAGKGRWINASLPDGRTGWMLRTDIHRVKP